MIIEFRRTVMEQVPRARRRSWGSAVGVIVAVLAATLVVSEADAAPPKGPWSGSKQLAHSRVSNALAMLPDGRVLVSGGFYCTSGCTADGPNVFQSRTSAELWNSGPNRWSATGAMNTPRARHTLTVLADGKILAVGGDNCGPAGCVPVATAELYDPSSGRWSTTASMGSSRSGHTATRLSSGKVLVAGGRSCDGSCTNLATAQLYDHVTGSWSPTGNMSIPRNLHTATILPDGKVLSVGGEGFEMCPCYSSSVDVYDPVTGAWSPTSRTRFVRADHTATALIDGRVLVAGRAKETELYDPTSGTWSTTGSLNDQRYVGLTATRLIDGKVLVAGGSPGANSLTSSELWDPSTGIWSRNGFMSSGRERHSAILAPTGQVLVVGGQNCFMVNIPPNPTAFEIQCTSLNTSELFTAP